MRSHVDTWPQFDSPPFACLLYRAFLPSKLRPFAREERGLGSWTCSLPGAERSEDARPNQRRP
jgi:hypothetical protein